MASASAADCPQNIARPTSVGNAPKSFSLNIARALSDEGVKILGTSIDSIDIAEDRDLFRKMMDQLGIPMPESGMATSIDEALACVKQIGGYPVMIRPSFVLGGRGMEVIYDENMLREYVAKAVGVTPDRPLLIDRFLHNALECEADALSDGEHVYIPSVMEHVELAGVHSGDSACIIPPVTITKEKRASECCDEMLAFRHDRTQPRTPKASKLGNHQGIHQEDC